MNRSRNFSVKMETTEPTFGGQDKTVIRKVIATFFLVSVVLLLTFGRVASHPEKVSARGDHMNQEARLGDHMNQEARLGDHMNQVAEC